MTHVLDLRNSNSLWAGVLVETLVRTGVRRAVISPGSRSTPLTIAFAQHPQITATPVLDERSAAFFALGLAKAGAGPVVLVCTSGTAAANYFPAVIEAQESAVPLLVLTADRPPELRACASGQTIDQQKLYGAHVSFFHELAVPELDLGRLRYLRQTILHAATRTLRPQAGPVHLNVPFRDPLAPIDDGGKTREFAGAIDWTAFFAEAAPTNPTISTTVPPRLVPEAHGLIVVGPNQPANPAEFAAQVGTMAQRLGWPVLAEGLSPLRNYASQVPNLVTTYDAILRQPEIAERLRPEVVIGIGSWPTSKVLRSWLESTDAPIWLLSERVDNRDALHGRTRTLGVSVGSFAASLPGVAEPGAYAGMWSRYERATRTALDATLTATDELFEPKACWLLAQHLPPGTPLFIANSMPIRDVEYVWPAGERAIRPFCNRGANGIDGTLSTALGVAEASGRPSVLLTGDLALLHDTNGFLLRPRLHSALTIVLVNNRGGGIFEHLPVSQFDLPFEEFFATPQDIEFTQLCATYGVEHVKVENWDQFGVLVRNLPQSGVRILELRTDRKRDAAHRKALFGDVGKIPRTEPGNRPQ